MNATRRIEWCLEQIDEWIGPRGVEGAACAVWHAGDIVATHYAGQAQAGVPVDASTLFALASVTKPVTAAVVMRLVESGVVALDDPVAHFVPEFGAPSDWDKSNPAWEHERSAITIRQLLSHTSGLPEDLPTGVAKMRDQPSLDEITDAMCRVPLRALPGTQLLYSNAGFAVLGRLVERVSGEDFWRVAAEAMLEPLGLQNTYGPPPPSVTDRIATVADAPRPRSDTESYNSDYWRSLGIPWGGLFGSPVDLVQFAAAFLTGTSPILSPRSMQEMTTDQVHGLPGTVVSARVNWPVAWWGLGWEVKGHKRSHWTGDLTSPSTFCHFGASGTLLWANPEVGLAVAIFANRTTIHLWPFIPPRWARLSDCLVEAVTGD